MTLLALALALHLTARAEPIAAILGDGPATEIRRIMPSETPTNLRLDGIPFIAGYEVIGDPIPLSADQARTVQDLTADPDAFDSEGKATCKFRPGIAIRFGSGEDATDLLVCFACDEVATVPLGNDVSQLAILPQSSRDVLLALAKAALPSDSAIQELPPVRREGSAPPPFAPIPPPSASISR